MLVFFMEDDVGDRELTWELGLAGGLLSGRDGVGVVGHGI